MQKVKMIIELEREEFQNAVNDWLEECVRVGHRVNEIQYQHSVTSMGVPVYSAMIVYGEQFWR